MRLPMIFDAKKRTQLFAMVAICVFLLASATPTMAQQSTPTYTYNMTFDKEGFTTVEVLYDSGFPGSGSSWIAVPKNFTSTGVTALKGTITSMARLPYRPSQEQTAHPFYDNLTFSYDSVAGPFSMRILFNMTYGAMIVEPNGFFYSPEIGVPPSAKVEARLILPDGVENLNEAVPTPTQVERLGSRFELLFDLGSESRIALTFTVSWANQTSHLQEGMVAGEVPTRYQELGARMVALYRLAVPRMNELVNNTVNRITVRFFAPATLPDLSIGGYTPIDPSTFQTGAIYLNLFYFRAVPGIMETIAIHELTHQYLAAAGISPDLLWVQEGLANYVAVQMGKSLGYDVSSTDAELEAAANQLNGSYGIVQNWQPGTTTASLFLYYAASYKVFKTLGDEYGGLTLYSKFFRSLHELKDGLRSTNVAVSQLGLAASGDLYPQFTQWGFQLIDLSGIGAQIAKLRREAQIYGPLLPFREEALGQIQQAENSQYTAPEAAFGHLKLAAYYIETVPMIIGGIVLVIILLVAIAVAIARRRRPNALFY
jgi:hypothetical protein